MTEVIDFLLNLVKASLALFIIVDPVGQIPLFLGLTKDMPPSERRRAFNMAVYVGSSLLFIFALAGHRILQLFGITIYSFMIAGGVLLMLLAIRIIIGGEAAARFAHAEDVGVFPIAFPLLSGPGAITTTMIAIESYGVAVTILSIINIMAVTWILLRNVERVYAVLGRVGSEVIARVMAVLIAAIAVEFIITGVKYYYP
ncbi:MAG TPA: MarC family protein [Candidatus Caldiarchaeum subterraneum]|uniref:UPF0056 membrane protein n=1 Tax=Caldiarchaeum subterraneum TaxID=311458 RepID=A0A833EBD3_CALS0|nr:MarC family protein [Candidatus Caldarchaeum subterraneum]